MCVYICAGDIVVLPSFAGKEAFYQDLSKRMKHISRLARIKSLTTSLRFSKLQLYMSLTNNIMLNVSNPSKRAPHQS